MTKKSSKTKSLKLGLAENALDFIRNGIAQISGKDLNTNKAKYGLLHFVSGVELLLKKKLFDEDWKLIFRNISKASEDKLRSGDFESAYLDDCVERLTRDCGVSIAPKDVALLKTLKRERNKVEHYELSISQEEIESFLVKGWEFVLDFVAEHLKASDILEDEIDSIRTLMVGHEAFVKTRLEAIQPKLDEIIQSKGTFVSCPRCLNDAFAFQEDRWHCLFCRSEFTPDEALAHYVDQIEEYGLMSPKEQMTEGPELADCHWCGGWGNKYMLHASFPLPNSSDDWICFNCGNTISSEKMVVCLRCETHTFSENGEPTFCASCVDDINEMD